MTKVTYEIIRHEDGWAYKARGTISETFPSHDAALVAARTAAGEQKVPGETVGIQYETADGQMARGSRLGPRPARDRRQGRLAVPIDRRQVRWAQGPRAQVLPVLAHC